MIAEELQVAGVAGGDQLLQEQPPEQDVAGSAYLAPCA
jgi:hypothetical protein